MEEKLVETRESVLHSPVLSSGMGDGGKSRENDFEDVQVNRNGTTTEVPGEELMTLSDAKPGYIGIRYARSYHFGKVFKREGKTRFQRLATSDVEGKVAPVFANITDETALNTPVKVFNIKEIPKRSFAHAAPTLRPSARLTATRFNDLEKRQQEAREAIEKEALNFLRQKVDGFKKQAPQTAHKNTAPTTFKSKPAATKSITPPSDDQSWNKTISEHEGLGNFRLDPSQVPEVVLKGDNLQLSGQWLLEVLHRPPPSVLPKSTGTALAQTTMRQHVRYLERVAAVLNPKQPLGTAIVNAVEYLKELHNWRNSTTVKAQASIQGALKILPVYRENAPVVKIAEDPIWSLSMRTRAIECKEETPVQPKPATTSQVMHVIAQTEDEALAMALLFGWYTASRLGCIRQLRREDVKTSDQATSITFRRGKGVKASGPYTVHTAPLPPELLSRWNNYAATRETVLFPRRLTGRSLKEALRTIDPSLEQRSIRRGALQAMASHGTSEETLMRFSGHKRVETLRRYLNWNAVNSKVQSEMVNSAQHIVLDPRRRTPQKPVSATA